MSNDARMPVSKISQRGKIFSIINAKSLLNYSHRQTFFKNLRVSGTANLFLATLKDRTLTVISFLHKCNIAPISIVHSY